MQIIRISSPGSNPDPVAITNQIQQAIDRLYKDGGGRIEFESGTYPIGYWINPQTQNPVRGREIKPLQNANGGLVSYQQRNIMLPGKPFHEVADYDPEQPFIHFKGIGSVTFLRPAMPEEPLAGKEALQYFKDNFGAIVHTPVETAGLSSFEVLWTKFVAFTSANDLQILALIQDPRFKTRLETWNYIRGHFNWHRSISTYGNWVHPDYGTGYIYKSSVDSGLIKFENIVFDGNRGACWESVSYELEQSAMLFVTGSPADSGRVRLVCQNCHFQNNYGDGVHLVHNVNAKFNKCVALEIFRGGITMTGRQWDVEINNFESVLKRYSNSGILVEVDGPNDAAEQKLLVKGGISGSLNFITKPGAEIRVEDHVVRGLFYQGTPGAKVNYRNVRFETTPETISFFRANFAIVLPGQASFEECEFVVDDLPEIEHYDTFQNFFLNNSFRSASVNPNSELPDTEQELVFRNCSFLNKTTYRYPGGLINDADQVENNNFLILEKPLIFGNFKYGFLFEGGNVVLDGLASGSSISNADTSNALLGYAIVGTDSLDLTIQNIDSSHFTAPAYANFYHNGGTCTITHRNVFFQQADNHFFTLRLDNLRTVNHLGGRILYGADGVDPISAGGSIRALKGDLFYSNFPIANQTGLVLRRSWSCTNTGYGNSPATWILSNEEEIATIP